MVLSLRSERDLGVIFSSDLKWKNHITERESKANAMLGMIKKTFASLNCKLLKTLYTTYVRPLVEFAVPVWNPYLKGEIEALEKIQHRATRLVKNLRKLPYEQRLEKLNITTLSARRNRGDLIQVFKTLNGYEKIDLIAKPELHSASRGHNFSYKREQTKFTARQEFLLNRAANNWNSLSMKTIQSASVNQFKANLDNEMNKFGN